MMNFRKLFFICSALFLFLSCSQKDGQFYYNQAELQTNKENYKKALSLAGQAEKLFSKSDFQWKEVVVLQGEIYLWQNQIEKAVDEFSRALENFPEDDEVLLNIVATCVRCGKPEIAKDFCEKGILSKKYGDTTNGLFYYYLAELEFGMDYEKCRDLIMQAKICFLKSNTDKFDKKIEDFISRLSEN